MTIIMTYEGLFIKSFNFLVEHKFYYTQRKKTKKILNIKCYVKSDPSKKVYIFKFKLHKLKNKIKDNFTWPYFA